MNQQQAAPGLQRGGVERRAFGPVVVEYDDRVLAPRSWTLEQSFWAADLAAHRGPGPILELYCGAGHIGLAAASLCGRELVQVDDNEYACTWAGRNAERLSIQADVRCAGVDSALGADEHFSVVIADPPYLRSEQVAQYPDDPAHAVDGGPDGLTQIGRALSVVAEHANADAAVLLQVRGPEQVGAVSALLADSRIPLQITETRTITTERSIVLLEPTRPREPCEQHSRNSVMTTTTDLNGRVMPTLLDDRASAVPEKHQSGHHEITVRVVAEGGGSGPRPSARARRRLPSAGSFVAALGIAALALVGFLIVGALTGLVSIGNPFSTSTIDRSQPALLKQINNLSRFDAAQGKFESTIDIEHDVGILPSFIAGDRTVFLAQGTVDATVDFSALGGNAVQPGADGHVMITLPEPMLGQAVLNTTASHVASRDRGILNRLGGIFSASPTSERELYITAQHKITNAAKESSLVARGEKNTTAMLQGFLGRLGYTHVEVAYTASPKHKG